MSQSILYDELEKRKFNSISIGFNKSNQKLYYKIIEKMNFRDHHNFTKVEVHKINRKLAKNPKAVIFTTEKDAQRMMEKTKFSQSVKERMFYIPIEVAFINENSEIL